MITRRTAHLRMAAVVGRLKECGVVPLIHAVTNPMPVNSTRDDQELKMLASHALRENVTGLLKESMTESVGSGLLELGDARCPVNPTFPFLKPRCLTPL